MSDATPIPTTDAAEDAVDLAGILAEPNPDMTVALCRLCREAGVDPVRTLPNDDTLQDAAAKHCIAKHSLTTDNVAQYVTDVLFTRVDDFVPHMEFVTRAIGR